jgi:hypothetical protein
MMTALVGSRWRRAIRGRSARGREHLNINVRYFPLKTDG